MGQVFMTDTGGLKNAGKIITQQIDADNHTQKQRKEKCLWSRFGSPPQTH